MKVQLKFKIRNIIGYEDLYTIDVEGRVFGKKRQKYLEPQTNNHGYFLVNLSKNNEQKTFLIHRLIALHFKPNPENKPTVDHKDGNRLNNNIDNLRWATRSQQSMNKNIQSNNTSGFVGVHKRRDKWRAQIKINGKQKHLGLFDTPEEASAVREAEARKLFGEFKAN